MDKHDQNHNDWDGSNDVIKSDKLLQSVKDGNNSAVKYLLEQGEDPNTLDEVFYLLLGLCVKLLVVLNIVKLMSRSRSGEGQEGQGQSQV